MSVIDKVRLYAQRGWGPKNYTTLTALTNQKAAYIFALTYIADEANAEDIEEIKEIARVALGREWNEDGDPVEVKERT
jgi:hypothetical protein